MKQHKFTGALLIATALVSVTHAQTPAPATAEAVPVTAATTTISEESGLAAVYSDKLSGHMTASGKKYDSSQLTAAHKTLPFGTRVRITNVNNGKSVEVRITDRGPRQTNRILDITPRAARVLGISKMGMAQVKLTVL